MAAEERDITRELFDSADPVSLAVICPLTILKLEQHGSVSLAFIDGKLEFLLPSQAPFSKELLNRMTEDEVIQRLSLEGVVDERIAAYLTSRSEQEDKNSGERHDP